VDPALEALFVPAVIGGTAGFIGGTVAALDRKSDLRHVFSAVLAGTGTGTFIAPAIVSWLTLPVSVAGVVCFVGGLAVYGLIAGVR
jgi:hypothetical protein